MSNHDETAADVPVRDTAVPMSTLQARLQPDPPVLQNARSRQDVSRVSREELEDRFLYLQEENVHLKEHANIQDEKIKKLGTKLMKMVKDRGRLEQLVAGRGQPVSKVRDLEMEEMVEELQEKVQTLQKQNEVLKQRHHASRQQLLSLQSRRAPPYGHIQSRVNSGLKKLHDDASSGSRPKCSWRLEGGKPSAGLLPRFGHSLLEEARAEIRSLENVNELQQNNMKEMERALALLQEELRKKEADYEEKLLLIRQQRTSKVRSHVDSNVTLIKLQKQLADRSNTVTEMEARFLQLQESQKTLKASYDAAVGQADELLAQLKSEKQKNLELADQLQLSNVANIRAQQLQEQLNDVEQERDLLKESNAKLLNSAFDVSREQKWQIQEQQLRVQISQLERALQADLVDKNEILDRIKAEQEAKERLTEEMKKLKIDCLEKQLQLEELNSRLKLYSREGEFSAAELTEALLLIKKEKAQKKMGFLTEVEEDTNSLRELKAAHAETIQELQKTRKILNMESNICNDYKLELEQLSKKMNSDQARYRQTLEQQTQLLDARAAKINKLEAQLREIAYGAKMYTFQAEVTGEHEADEETVHLEHGENLLELHIIGATLSPSAMELLGECEPSTFCTYTFYKFEMHCTPLVMGDEPKYGFTSKYIVNMDNDFLEYVHRHSVTVELHQKLVGCNWRTVAASQLRLQQLLEHEGKVQGSVPLVGMSNEVPAFGSLHYWFRLKLPMTETIHLYKEKVKAVDYIHSALSQDTQQLSSSRWNELHITVQRCRDLKPRGSQEPSPYVVFRFFKFPDYPTATVHGSFQPHFSDTKSYSVCMDTELDQYLRQELIQFYVFDFKEQELDSYMGKVRIPLLPLAQDQEITGVFELTDDSGHPAGHIEVMLKWKSTYKTENYFLPSSSISTTKDGQYFLPGSTFLLTGGRKEEVEQEKEVLHPWQDEEKDETQEEERANGDAVNATSQPDRAACQVPLPKPRQKTHLKEVKKVTFVDASITDNTQQAESLRGVSVEKTQMSPSHIVKDVLSPASQSTEEEKDEESQFSEGQLVSTSCQSDDSELSEEIVEDVVVPPAKEDQGESTESDSDDCIVQAQTTGRKPSERMRVEILSLSLVPEGRVAQDSSVARLFVEYSLLDLHTEETPLSLPKPPRGTNINYNYSKVVPVDAENNSTRRQLLRAVLQGKNPQMERIRFTVVSEPPEEEEDRECEDVGVAFLRIPDILEQQQDLTETSLNSGDTRTHTNRWTVSAATYCLFPAVLDVTDSSETLGTLTVTVEGLEALQAIMEDEDQDQETPITSLLLLR
ncbi:protein fantom isoform X4 [Takifugu flavidus]|nr:protein fantom isoform X4 [Takifugu flavidus]